MEKQLLEEIERLTKMLAEQREFLAMLMVQHGDALGEGLMVLVDREYQKIKLYTDVHEIELDEECVTDENWYDKMCSMAERLKGE